jgi:hypothetical protein
MANQVGDSRELEVGPHHGGLVRGRNSGTETQTEQEGEREHVLEGLREIVRRICSSKIASGGLRIASRGGWRFCWKRICGCFFFFFTDATF